jgi:hypothetical protein
MTKRMNKRFAFHPSMVGAQLEERVVLSSTSTVVTPAPAPPPVYSAVIIHDVAPWRTVKQLRAAYAHQVKLATLDLRNEIASGIQQLYANGSVPASQKLTDFNASVQGALDATALRLSSQAGLLPGSGRGLVSKIQNSLLGSGSRSLSSALGSVLQSNRNTVSAARLQSALGRAITLTANQINPQFTNFFNTTNLNRLSVNSSGQQIPIQQFMAGQVVNQLSNALGLLAQSFPNVANATLFPNSTTGTISTTGSGTTGNIGNPTQDALNAFSQQVNTALNNIGFQLANNLALFNGSSNVISQLAPQLFGSSTSGSGTSGSGTSGSGNTGSGTTGSGTTGSTSNLISLVSALQNLPFGGTGFNSAVTSAFNSGFGNLAGTLNSFLGMQGQSNLTLPTSGLTSPFLSQFSGSSFNSGFNNGFASGSTPGFVGFGTSPSDFNSNFGTGFNNLVSSVTQNSGFVNTPLGTIGNVGGVPVVSK